MANQSRRTTIMLALRGARYALRSAADHRAEGRIADAISAGSVAAALVRAARQMMAEAPASSRRRWKASAVIATRKAYARTMNRAGGSGINRGGRIVYRNV